MMNYVKFHWINKH